jgi:hypothetical protein
MPVSAPDPAASGTPTNKTVYVWECLGEPGKYALCTNRDYAEYKTANWKFRGELSTVDELNGFRRDAINNKTVNGWPMELNIDQNGNYSY